MNDFPRHENNSGRKRRYDEFSACEYTTEKDTGCATSQAGFWATITQPQPGNHQATSLPDGTHGFMPSFEISGEWAAQQWSTADYGSWNNLERLPEIPNTQGHSVQHSISPSNQQYALQSVDMGHMIPKSYCFRPPNHANPIYNTMQADQQYGAQHITVQQLPSYSVAPVQGSSSYQPEHGGLLVSGNSKVSHNMISSLVHILNSNVGYDVLTTRKARPIY